jgi:hypothetical protein
MRVVAASCVAIAIGLTILCSPGSTSTQAAGPHIDLYFMSAANGTGSPLKYCTGTFNPPIHGSDRAIDVPGDGTGSVCYGDNSSDTRLRGWGYGGSTNHHTMGVWASGGQVTGGCDVVLLGMIDVAGGLHGQLRYVHTTRTVPTNFQMQMWAGPNGYKSSSYKIGVTTADDGCPWEGYHVHQGTLLDCMTVNAGLVSATQYEIWNPWTFINLIDYAEGLHGCDG